MSSVSDAGAPTSDGSNAAHDSATTSARRSRRHSFWCSSGMKARESGTDASATSVRPPNSYSSSRVVDSAAPSLSHTTGGRSTRMSRVRPADTGERLSRTIGVSNRASASEMRVTTRSSSPAFFSRSWAVRSTTSERSWISSTLTPAGSSPGCGSDGAHAVIASPTMSRATTAAIPRVTSAVHHFEPRVTSTRSSRRARRTAPARP